MSTSTPNWDDDYYAVEAPKPLDGESDVAFTLRHTRWVRDSYQAQVSGSLDPDDALIELAGRAQAAFVEAQIAVLAETILEQSRERLARQYSAEQASWEKVEIKPGKKYVKIDRGPKTNMSGMLMIEPATGEIYGIKGYGVIHRGHHYGNLSTIDQWYWGDYYPRKRES